MRTLITLEYYERRGSVHFRYSEKVYRGRGYWLYVAEAKVPKEITDLGARAIREYADKEIKRIVDPKRERDRIFDENRRKINVPISSDYTSGDAHAVAYLKGRVVCLNDELTVVLEEPVHGSEVLAWGNSRGSAMAGHKVWAEPGVRLTDKAIACARLQLVDIYKMVISPAKDLVRELNRKIDGR